MTKTKTKSTRGIGGKDDRYRNRSAVSIKWFPLCSSRQCTTIDPRSDNKHQLSTSGLPVRMPHPKVLGFRALYFAVAYGIFFIFFICNFQNVIFHFFGRCPKNCSIARKTIILPDSGGCSPPSPLAHTPMNARIYYLLKFFIAIKHICVMLLLVIIDTFG